MTADRAANRPRILERDQQRLFGLAALTLGLALLTGCPPKPGVGVAPRTVDEAVERVNQNLSGMRDTLACNGLVSFRFREQDGSMRTFTLQDAKLFFSPPQNVRFSVQTLQGETAQVGSNDERYWVWLDVDPKRMWWGSWELVSEIDPNALPIPPGDLFDGMLLRPLPDALYGGVGPYLRLEGDDHRLVYVRRDAEGNTSGYRELKLQTAPPYMPTEIVDRSREGVLLMRATLERYEPVEGGPLLARRYRVEWPATDSQLDLELLRAKFRPELEPEMFSTFPDWQHECIRLDPAPQPPPRAPRGDSPRPGGAADSP